MNIGKVIAQYCAIYCAIGAIVAGTLSWVVGKSHYHSIESATRIEPELKLTVKDNKVDTIYIYRRP